MLMMGSLYRIRQHASIGMLMNWRRCLTRWASTPMWTRWLAWIFSLVTCFGTLCWGLRPLDDGGKGTSTRNGSTRGSAAPSATQNLVVGFLDSHRQFQNGLYWINLKYTLPPTPQTIPGPTGSPSRGHHATLLAQLGGTQVGPLSGAHTGSTSCTTTCGTY